MRIDHFMYAVPDLDAGMRWAEETFGVAPVYGGRHAGLGTCNALLSLQDTYLEIIAPDPNPDVSPERRTTLGDQFSNLSAPGLVTWALEGPLDEARRVLNQHDLKCHGPVPTQRVTLEGETLAWELLFPVGTAFGGRMPFFIDWLDCPNPAQTSPEVGRLESVQIADEAANNLGKILSDLQINVSVEAGAPHMQLLIQGRNGMIELHSTQETSRIRIS